MGGSIAHTGAHTGEIKNPGTFETPAAIRNLLIVFLIVGIATFAWALGHDRARAWTAFTINHFYFMSLAIGGVFFAAIQFVSNAMWSAPIRRVSESFSAYLPFVLLSFVGLYFGMHDLYPWTHADHVEGDLVLQGKSGYLNVTFFVIRNLVALALWIFLARKIIGNSLSQDSSRDVALTAANRKLAPAFLAVFAISYTMISFDQLMSLDPHWFSTMFGVYCFAGLFYTTLALTCLMTIYLHSKGKLIGLVNENHLHDLGKFMFAFTVFWAYIGFSQYMLIWYANLPEETGYFMRRFDGGWLHVSLFLLVGKFMLPFFVLLPRGSKRNPRILALMAVFMLFAHWFDLLWLVQPEFFKEGPRVGLIELGVTLGFLGLFGLSMFRFLSRNNVVAIGDPKLAESVLHHHI